MMEKTSLTGWKQELTLVEEDTAAIVLPLPLGQDSLALSQTLEDQCQEKQLP